jgi:hypothetical protein
MPNPASLLGWISAALMFSAMHACVGLLVWFGQA